MRAQHPPPAEQCWACGAQSAPFCDAASWSCQSCAAVLERPPAASSRPPPSRLRAALLPPAVAALICGDAYLGIVHLLPHAAPHAPTTLLLLRAFSCALAGTVLGHFATTLAAHASYPHPRQPRGWTPGGGADSSRGHRFCRLCDVVQPVGSHHCRRCRRCVADRQHHCPFLGVCVGLCTLRPFLCFLATAACGAALALSVCATLWWRRKTELLLSAFSFHSTSALPNNLHLSARGALLRSTMAHLGRGAAHVGRTHSDWLLPLALAAPLNALVLLATATLFVRTVRVSLAGMEDLPAHAAGGRDIEGHFHAGGGGGGGGGGGEPGWQRRRRLRRAVLGSEAWGAVAWAFWVPRAGPPGGSRAARLLGLDKRGHDA